MSMKSSINDAFSTLAEGAGGSGSYPELRSDIEGGVMAGAEEGGTATHSAAAERRVPGSGRLARKMGTTGRAVQLLGLRKSAPGRFTAGRALLLLRRIDVVRRRFALAASCLASGAASRRPAAPIRSPPRGDTGAIAITARFVVVAGLFGLE